MKQYFQNLAEISVLIHYHCFPEPHRRRDSETVKRATQRFLRDGLIEVDNRIGCGDYITTDAGKACLEALKQAPMPESPMKVADRMLPAKPGLPVVPLGANRTRDGREAFVFLVTPTEIQGFVQEFESRFMKAMWHPDGCFPGRAGTDLVGHLPPEPPKPREFSIRRHKKNGNAMVFPVDQPGDGSDDWENIHVREVLPATGKQYHVWVDGDGDCRPHGYMDEEYAKEHSYRKAILMEVQP